MVLSSLVESAPVRPPMTRIQIFRFVSKNHVLDISDMLSLDTRRNKIAFALVAFDPETHRATTRVRHFADASDFKLVCWDILYGLFTEWVDHKGTPHEEVLQARVLTLKKEGRQRPTFALRIDNGVGESLPGGAVKMVEATESLTLGLPEFDARQMAQTVLDYIRDWETVHFRQRRDAQTIVLPGLEFPAEAEPTVGALATRAERKR